MVEATLDALLETVDAKAFPGDLFANEEAKERYETLWMYAWRKRQASQYHRDRIDALESEFSAEVPDVDANDSGTPVLPAVGDFHLELESRITIQINANEFYFELSAFLAALRSAVDFVAKAAARHVTGLNCNSVSRILKHLDQGKTSPVHEKFSSWEESIRALRDYRDELVHRQVASMSCGWMRISRTGHEYIIRFPPVLPVVPRPAALDSRRSRAAESAEDFVGTAIEELESRIQNSGAAQLLNFSITASPAAGYERIQVFMDRHLQDFDALFSEIATWLTSNGLPSFPPMH